MNFVGMLQFLPLTIFLLTYRLSLFLFESTDILCLWQPAFVAGTIAAIAQIAFYLYKKYEFNPIILAVNCFLIGGGLGMIFHIGIILEFYKTFMQTALLIWLLIIGIMTTLFSKKGFIGVEHANRSKIIVYSLILIIATIIAIIWSLYFKNNFFLSAFVPFASMVFLRKILMSIITKN